METRDGTTTSQALRERRRIVVISDLHLGGSQPAMMSSGSLLAAFIDELPRGLGDDETLELVIAGDFVDFLAVAPWQAWTVEAGEAVRKLAAVMGDAAFSGVFAALRRLTSAGHGLTILIGNHDLELALPAVQEALLVQLAGRGPVRLVDDGRAYRVGRVLIEHGNRYDPSNENDWGSLRAIASAQSRFEAPSCVLNPSAGSVIVERVIAGLKQRYPFVDLLQPQGQLTALLLAAFEPGLALDIPKIARMLRAQQMEAANPWGLQPMRATAVASTESVAPLDPELLQAFGDDYRELAVWHPLAPQPVAASDVLLAAWRFRHDGLEPLMTQGQPVPPGRLEKLRVAMSKILLGDRSAAWDADTGAHGRAAQRLIADSGGRVELVVMGHTHLPRRVGAPYRPSYINTGTWADVIRVPQPALEPDGAEALQEFLAGLLSGRMRSTPATFADIRLAADGTVLQAWLKSALPGGA